MRCVTVDADVEQSQLTRFKKGWHPRVVIRRTEATFLSNKVCISYQIKYVCMYVNILNFRKKTSSRTKIAQLGERQTEDLKVPGPNPENSHEF